MLVFVLQRKRMVVPAALKIVRLKPTRKVSLKYWKSMHTRNIWFLVVWIWIVELENALIDLLKYFLESDELFIPKLIIYWLTKLFQIEIEYVCVDQFNFWQNCNIAVVLTNKHFLCSSDITPHKTKQGQAALTEGVWWYPPALWRGKSNLTSKSHGD